MLLSIVVPIYNVESYLSNCLESLINQDISPENHEILIINDGSTDNSPQIALQYEQTYEQIKVIHQENQGTSTARNKGIELARGKYIYFMDSDDYISYNSLGYLVSLLQENNLEILVPDVLYNTKDLNVHRSRNYDVIGIEEIEITDGISYIAENPYLNNVWMYLIDREFLLKTGITFPDGRLHQDTIFTASVLTQTERIGKSSLDFYRYINRPGSIMTKKTESHDLKRIADYQENIDDFKPLLAKITESAHPKAKACLKRLKAKRDCLVFLMLLICIRIQLPQRDLTQIIQRLTKSGAYPISKEFNREYKNFGWSQLKSVMNHKFLLFKSVKYLIIFHRATPRVQAKIHDLTKLLAGLRR